MKKTANFAEIRRHAAGLGIDLLRLTIINCCAARDASKRINDREYENYYQDLASTYNAELTKRTKK